MKEQHFSRVLMNECMHDQLIKLFWIPKLMISLKSFVDAEAPLDEADSELDRSTASIN